MPTAHCHLSGIISSAVAGMFHTTSDRAAFIVAGVAGSAPWWLHGVNDIFVLIGPTLAGLFLASKVILGVLQIIKEAISIRRLGKE